MTKGGTFAKVLLGLERQYLTYEAYLSICSEINNLGTLPTRPKAAGITELLADLDYLVGRLTPGLYWSDELLF